MILSRYAVAVGAMGHISAIYMVNVLTISLARTAMLMLQALRPSPHLHLDDIDAKLHELMSCIESGHDQYAEYCQRVYSWLI